MKNPLHHCDALTRRHFVERCAATAFGLNVIPAASLWANDSNAATPRGPGFGKAERVIMLQLDGGLSHIDTFDPKSGKSKGPGDTIKTAADFQMTQYLPKIAAIADKIAVIRSMTADIGVHTPARYHMRTAYSGRGTIRHPHLGAWAQHYLGRSHPTMPSSVCINRRSDHGNGFFPPSYSPLSLGNPESGLKNVRALDGEKKMGRRLSLLNSLDADFRKKSQDKNVQAYNGYYEDALSLMNSSELSAFDIAKETQQVREAYGNSALGQGCLLARRLVTSGVRFVEVAHDGWDFHKDLEGAITELAPVFDQAYAALILDLERLGMLDSTLVVVSTEFGRKPSFDGNGRGHHPACFSTVLAGGGVKRGFVYGASDEIGQYVEDDAVTIGAFHATIGWSAGMAIEKEMITPSGRPFTVGDHEKPILEMFS